MANNRLDVIIFGATGFTGKHTVEKAALLAKEKQFKFGVAGRRKEALEDVVKTYAPDIDNVPIIIADIKDKESLKKMAEQAKVIVNCCGPYRFYGEPVVRACIETRTHHVDVSGEPQYMERMQLKYNNKAKQAGVYIVSACGFDSIPCDLGVIFTQKVFEGEINSIETYLKASQKSNVKSPVVAYGTWESLIYGIAHMNELRGLRQALFPEKLPPLQPKLRKRAWISKNHLGWFTHFLGADRSVVNRTQRFFYEKYKQRPIQVQTYVNFESLWQIFLLFFVGLILYVMGKTSYTRSLLLKYPSLFSFGFVTREAPKKEAMEHVYFSIEFEAEGWTKDLSEKLKSTDKPIKPNKLVRTCVSGRNPGYGVTCVAVMLSALTIIDETDKIPDNGGVLTPGAAFKKTSIIDELMKYCLEFKLFCAIEFEK